MFCPKCGQQQATDEMRFCSRCGFQLAVVTALIATGGVPPAVIVTKSEGESKLVAKKRKRQGAKLMFASGVVSPIAIAFSIVFDSPIPLFLPFTIFLAGMALMLYFRWFDDDVSMLDNQSSLSQLRGAKQDYLPPAQTSFAAGSTRPSQRTAEIVQPSSVTEHTTKLLELEKDKI